MGMEISNNYSSYVSKSVTESARNRLKARTSKMSGSSKSESTKENIIRQTKQATDSLNVNYYGNELAKEAEKLKEQRGSYGIYSASDKQEDYAKAYKKLYDEIVQGYENGTRDRYVEDKTSETGYRKMMMEEEISGLYKAFQRATRNMDVSEMISGELARLSAKAGNKEISGTNKKSQTEGSAEHKTDYMNKLKKLAPSVEFRTGFAPAGDKSGKTLTINPKLLEKMQNDPEMEKKMKELIAGVEKMEKIAEAFNKATGWTTVYRHSYIDENGNYCHIAMSRNDYMLNLSDKLREERRENAEKLLERQKENAKKKKEELEETLEEKADPSKVEKLFRKKIEMAASKDGIIYVDDAEFKVILEAIKEKDAEKTEKKEPMQVGANLDLKV